MLTHVIVLQRIVSIYIPQGESLEQAASTTPLLSLAHRLLVTALLPTASKTEMRHLPDLNLVLGDLAARSMTHVLPWFDCFLFNYANVMRELWTTKPAGK